MKKLASILLAALTGLLFWHCGDSKDDVPKPDDNIGGEVAPENNENPETAQDGKMLVVFFSRAGENWQVGVVERGNTAIMADYILDYTGADVFEIKNEKEYPSNYNEMLAVATAEIESDARPAYNSDHGSLDGYQTIFIGGPVWHGRPPMIFRTFFEKHPELSTKTIIPFGTHGGSGVGCYTSLIKEYYPDAKLLTSLGISGSQIRDTESIKTVNDWLQSLGIQQKPSQNSQAMTQPFNFETKTVLLNSGYQMPIIGIGTYLLSDSQAEESVYNALKTGMRLIDCADIYGNERGVGRGIKRAMQDFGIKREEIFVTSKLWTSSFSNADYEVDERLEKLGIEYIDLLLLHHTAKDDEFAYQAMERGVKAGKIRSIGLSNFYEDDIDRMMKIATIKPAVLQNETHPYHQSRSVKQHIAKLGTVLEAWFPLGGRGTGIKTLTQHETITAIAKAHSKSAYQVILRWHLQCGTIAIPGSSNAAHIAEDFDIFDFELSDDEMKQINDLECNHRFASY